MASSATPVKKKSVLTYDAIVRDVRAGHLAPVYFLMGEESYYIDRLTELIVDMALRPEERDFNLMTFFGAEADVDTIITTARGFPLGAERLVVVVKEAQRLNKMERLEFYLKSVQPSTVLVFCYMGGTIDRRTKVAGLLDKTGVLFESKKVYDNKLPDFVADYLRRRQVAIEPAAAQMMADFVGSDLNRMAGELDKLCIALSPGERVISPDFVTHHVGLSREFNVFELQDALGNKDVARVMLIADNFEKNKKVNSIQKILPMLFKYFTHLMLAYYAPERTERGIAAWLGQTDWQVRRNVLPAMKNYTGVKVMKIIAEIRRTDARSKGVDNPATDSGELLRELLFFILH